LDALRKYFSELLATFFYTGYSPKAPGTVGSLAALPFAWFLWQFPSIISWSIFLSFLLLAIWASHEIVKRSGVADNQCIVIDEVLGIFLTTSIAANHWLAFGAAFIFFRIFDIWKPGPIRWVDNNIKGGLGVVLDDLVAALLALLCLALMQYFII